MIYPDTYKGIKKLRTSELLSIITAFLLMLAGILSIQVQNNGVQGMVLWGRGVQFLTACGGLLGILAGIMQLAGTYTAGKELAPFHTAFFVSVVSLLVSIFVNNFGQSEETKNIFNYSLRLISLAVLLLIIKGVTVLAEKMNNAELVAAGKKVKTQVIILFSISLIGDIVLQQGNLPDGIVLTVAVSAAGIAMSAVIMGLLRKAIELLEAVPETKAEETQEASDEE